MPAQPEPSPGFDYAPPPERPRLRLVPDLPEAGPVAEKPPEVTREDYGAMAEDVLRTLREGGGSLADRYREARQTYVVEERAAGRPELAGLAEVLLDARLVLPIRDELTKAQEAGDRTKTEKLKPAIIRFNHELRDLIAETPPGMFTRDQLSGWLREASNDRFGRQVEHLLIGVVAEVAVAKRLRLDPGVETVRFASAEEETQNVDLVATLVPRAGSLPETKRIQVKCGRHSLEEPVTVHGNGVAEVGFTPEMLTGFGFGENYRTEASSRLRRALTLGFTPGRR